MNVLSALFEQIASPTFFIMDHGKPEDAIVLLLQLGAILKYFAINLCVLLFLFLIKHSPIIAFHPTLNECAGSHF